MPIVVSIGNGQMDNMSMSETANTLDCMHDQQAVMIKEENDATGTQDQVLRILQEAYGEKAVVEWGVAILAALQSAEVLQQEMHDSRDEKETENWNELDDGSLPCSELVAGWMLRDMREQSERRCSSQGQQSEKQRFEQSSKAVQVVPSKSTQNCKEMFNMWRKGKGLGLLRQALSKIQETREPSCSKEKRSYYTVRRLTPLEAERLQGFPDGWTDIGEWTDSTGKKRICSDSARYKALGNSIAIPPWLWVCDQIGQYLGEDKTMASLFDGIGGFPLIWSYLYGRENVLWASEIEEFPIAVTRLRFPD